MRSSHNYLNCGISSFFEVSISDLNIHTHLTGEQDEQIIGKMSQVSNKSKFRVVIVGGGIAGLTLANTLQNAGIDFVLLESRSVIDPQVGASIGMLPNGSRILDQVGCYDDLLALVDPIQRGMNHNRDGSLIGEPTDMPVLGAIR